jgi:hypothetical protein
MAPTRARATSRCFGTGYPSRDIVPASACVNPSSTRMSVVLPAPFGPRGSRTHIRAGPGAQHRLPRHSPRTAWSAHESQRPIGSRPPACGMRRGARWALIRYLCRQPPPLLSAPRVRRHADDERDPRPRQLDRLEVRADHAEHRERRLPWYVMADGAPTTGHDASPLRCRSRPRCQSGTGSCRAERRLRGQPLAYRLTDNHPQRFRGWFPAGVHSPRRPRAVVGRSEGAVEQGACWTSEWHIRTVGGLEAGEVSPVPPQPETSSVDQPGHAQWRYRAAVGGNAPRPCPADSGACCCATKATPSVRSVAFGRGDDRWHCDGFSMRLLRVGPTPTT